MVVFEPMTTGPLPEQFSSPPDADTSAVPDSCMY